MKQSEQDRSKLIVKTSIIGIITNVLLATFKAVIGLLSNSIAIMLDAVNNLSDAMSSIITIIGAKLASRRADKAHPLGHGRVEYISSMLVAAIVFYAGITSLVESVKKIINPEAASYNAVDLFIIAVAIVVKLILGKYVKTQGEKANSGALIASGSDASFDAVLSASVLVSAIIFLMSGISLEAYVGVAIAIVITKASVEMMRETLNDLIGHRTDSEISTKIKAILREEPDVQGAYDLVLFDYGPNKSYGAVHIELPDVMTVDEVDVLTRRLQTRVYKETGVILAGISVYSYNTKNELAAKIRDEIQKTVLAHEWALQVHGFYLEGKTIRFDVVLSFNVAQRKALKILFDELQQRYSDYTFQILPDVDITD
ncbi:MAG: cation transporter [Synergistaceae bacterium]|nr:cation transporter [Synergistaceae bacterium]